MAPSRQIDGGQGPESRTLGEPKAQPSGSPAKRPASLSEADDALLLDLAQRIDRRGLAAPALLWLEGVRPVCFLGSQLMHFLNPFVQLFVPSEAYGRLAGILEERAHLDRLLEHVEAVARSAPDCEAGR